MNHADHLNLIRDGITGGVWADLGSGDGAFTLALADLLAPHGIIHSVDKDARALKRQRQALAARFPHVRVHYHTADFSQPLGLPALDGILMANALHFIPRGQQTAVLSQLRGLLRPDGRMVMVEYDTDSGNRWVPHPFSYATWEGMAGAAGFGTTRLLAAHPSRFLGRFFAAVSLSANSDTG